MVIYCKSVHFHGFEDARDHLSFYEMSSFKEGKAAALADESGEECLQLDAGVQSRALIYQAFVRTETFFKCAYERFHAKYGIYQFVLVLRNVRICKNKFYRAYAQHLVLEQ